MSSQHSLQSYLEMAEQDNSKDFHLAFMAKTEFIDFFKREDKQQYWDDKLKQLKNLDPARSPLFEALLYFALWKTNKQYTDGMQSAQKFEETENIAFSRKWVWLLSHSIQTSAYIYKTFGHTDKIKSILERISVYVAEENDLPAHTLIKLFEVFNENITVASEEEKESMYQLLIKLSGKKYSDDPYNFYRSFLFEAIKIAHFLKSDEKESALQEKVIQTWVDEANQKGKASNIVKHALLKDALDYSVKVGKKEKIDFLKKELSKTDFSGELKEISLPADQIEKIKEQTKKYYENLEKDIDEHIRILSTKYPVEIIRSITNDQSLIRLNVQRNRDFVEKLIKEYPIQNIFPVILQTGSKVINLNTDEEKKAYRLHEQLLPYINETLWIINQIFEKIEGSLVNTSDIADFLTLVCGLNENIRQLINSGVIHHFQNDYVASVSILTP